MTGSALHAAAVGAPQTTYINTAGNRENKLFAHVSVFNDS